MPGKLSVRIRMYRQGLGDCFLLTFMRQGKDDFNMMLDCGLLQRTTNGRAIMRTVVQNIEATLSVQKEIDGAAKKWLDVVVLTHQHADHISGFSQAQDIFDRIHFGEVWTSWLDNKQHPKYEAVRERFHKQVTGLTSAMAKMVSPEQAELKSMIDGLLNDFFDGQTLGAKEDGRSAPWDYALNKSVGNAKYWSPGQSFMLDATNDVRIYILGPPEDYESFTRVNPPPDETYRSEGNAFAVADSFFAAVAGQDGLFEGELCQPFETHLRVAPQGARKKAFFRTHYGFQHRADNKWRRIDDDWLMMAGGLALNLDSYTNNTCLAFAIEFVRSKKVLLFPGDAQFANWISWKKLAWDVSDDGSAKQKVTTKDLLKRTVFYKVGHHGSHNATLKKDGLELMSHPDLIAMIPVDRDQAKQQGRKQKKGSNWTTVPEKQGWEMPERNLFDRLKERTRGRVLLADEGDTAKLKDRCKDDKFVKSVAFESPGTLVKATKAPSTAEPLYVEIIIED